MGWFDKVTETVSSATNTVVNTVSSATTAVTETVIAVDKATLGPQLRQKETEILNEGINVVKEVDKVTLGPEWRQKEMEILNEGINVVKEVDKVTLGPETRELERTFIDTFSHQIIKDTGGYVTEGQKLYDTTSDIIGTNIGNAVSKVEEELYEEEQVIEQTVTGSIRKGSDFIKDIGGQIGNVGGLIEHESQKLLWDYLGNPLVIGAGIVGTILLL
jgi:hypothetical protein